MTTRRFPRRVEIAAAMFAAAMFAFVFVPNASAQRVGCTPSETNFLTAHGFCDGFTDILFTPPGDILSLTGPQRIIFNHSSPFSYNSVTKLFQVQSSGGSREDFGEFGYKVQIGAYVDSSGKLMTEAALFTCDGGPASFCVQGSDGAVLIKGQVKGFAYVWNNGTQYDPFDPLHPYDDFAFYVKVTGGSRQSVYGNFMAVTVRGFVIDGMGRPFNGTFTQPADDTNCDVMNPDGTFGGLAACSFGGGVLGVMGASTQVGMLLDACNGKIIGTAKNGLLNSPIVGNEISLAGGDLVTNESRTTAANGSYAFTSTSAHATGLCAGTYSVNSDVPDGFAPGDLYPTTRSVTLVVDSNGNDVPSVAGANVVDFVFYPIISSDYKTSGQGGWGAKPNGNNAGALLQNYYSAVYGSNPVVIGSVPANKYVSLGGAAAVQNFLPQGGKPAAFNGAFADPGPNKPTNKLGTLAGETLALKLNVDFSASGLTKVGLGSLFVGSGALANCSVNQVLTYANSLLGGGALKGGITHEVATDTAGKINGNYEGGKSKGYLKATSGGTCSVQ